MKKTLIVLFALLTLLPAGAQDKKEEAKAEAPKEEAKPALNAADLKVKLAEVKSGSVWLRKPTGGEEDFSEIKADAAIEVGSWLMTEDGTDAVVTFFTGKDVKGANVTLSGYTHLRISEYAVGDHGKAKTRLSVLVGAVAAQTLGDDVESDFKIKTPQVTAAVRGTEFNVFKVDSKRTKIAVVESTVFSAKTVKNTALPAEVALNEGQETDEVLTPSINLILAAARLMPIEDLTDAERQLISNAGEPVVSFYDIRSSVSVQGLVEEIVVSQQAAAEEEERNRLGTGSSGQEGAGGGATSN